MVHWNIGVSGPLEGAWGWNGAVVDLYKVSSSHCGQKFIDQRVNRHMIY